MLEAKTQFEVEPALKVIEHCQQSHDIFFLDHCVCLLITSLQHYLRRDQENFEIKILEKLIDTYTQSHFSFMTQTEQLLDTLVAAQLMEPSFDIGLMSKLKAAKRFFQKARSKWETHLSTIHFDEVVQHYFHNISLSLIYCVDVHMDALRCCESAISSYKRQIHSEEREIANELSLQIEQAMVFLGASKKQNLKVRQILVNANLHIAHDSMLAQLIIRLRRYLISDEKLQPTLRA